MGDRVEIRVVNNNIDFAVNLLQRRMGPDFTLLRDRVNHPSVPSRKRAKARRVESRRRKKKNLRRNRS